jgi:hypothetical protein
MTRILILFILGFLPSCIDSIPTGQVSIQWISNLKGDFSFSQNWDYPEGVFKNSFGQLSCDGLCPERAQNMKDLNGKIFPDSLNAFYQLVDTTHQFHTIQCEAWSYEWAGTDVIKATKANADSIKCYTLTNAATHCSLHITITGNICIPIIELNSIADQKQIIYRCSKGSMKIEKEAFNKGFLKAEFDFDFNHPEDPKTKMYWKGRIFTQIE